MPKVFVSFVHEDENVALAVVTLLRSELDLGEEVFIASDTSITAGDKWFEKIEAALRESQIVVLMLSARSIARPWVNFEAGAAWLAGKTIIPCCFGSIRKGQMPHPYSRWHGLDLPDDDHKLVADIARLTGRPPALTVPRSIREKMKAAGAFTPKPAVAHWDGYEWLQIALTGYRDS